MRTASPLPLSNLSLSHRVPLPCASLYFSNAQPQYTDAFAAEGITMHTIRSLQNAKIKELIPVEGHKRRLLLALNELQPLPEKEPVAPRPKYNSTSSLYIDSTISKPCTDEIIFCVSIVIHDRIEEGEAELQNNPTMMDNLPDMFNTKSKPLLAQLDGHDTTEDTIFQSIKSIYSIAEFSSECLVISLLYIERLRSLTGLHLLMSNWQPILLAAMVVAQKVRAARTTHAALKLSERAGDLTLL